MLILRSCRWINDYTLLDIRDRGNRNNYLVITEDWYDELQGFDLEYVWTTYSSSYQRFLIPRDEFNIITL